MGHVIHAIGITRATMKIGMANIVYNVKRLICLQKAAMAQQDSRPQKRNHAVMARIETLDQDPNQTNPIPMSRRNRVDRTVQLP